MNVFENLPERHIRHKWFNLKPLLVYLEFDRLWAISPFLPNFPHLDSETHKLNPPAIPYILLHLKLLYTYRDS